MSRRHGNSAIISVGGRRRTGLDGRPISYGTHAAFASFKRDFDRRLQATGVHQLKPKNLKPKHIETVLGQLRAEVAAGTRSLGSAKNWCSHLRAFVRVIDRRYLELTRFRGYLILLGGGIHHATNTSRIPA